VVQIEKFARYLDADDSEFLDHHTKDRRGKASRHAYDNPVPCTLCAMGNGRYINVPTRERVAACPHGVKPWRGVIQESGSSYA
jgi:hypothetical protein